MKKIFVLFALVLVFGVVGTSNASLTTIGTASYDSNRDGTLETFNIIYEDDSIDGGLVWLDYSRPLDLWQFTMNWASGLGSNLTVNLNPNYTTDIDWSTGWRLPLTQQTGEGYNQIGSEMGHLYYVSLGNVAPSEPGYGGLNRGPFNNLRFSDHWSATEYSPDPDQAWMFRFNGRQGIDSKWDESDGVNCALAVHPGTVSAVPIPAAIWLIGSGLICLVGVGKKFGRV